MNSIARSRTAGVLIALLAAGPALAAGSGQTRGPIPFENFDADGDGYVSQQEFGRAQANRVQERAEQGGQFRNRANAPGFGDIDANGDGRLSREEVTAHQRERFENRQRMPGRQGGGMGAGMGGGNRQ